MRIRYNKVLVIISAAVILFGAVFFTTGSKIGKTRKNMEKRCTYKLTATVCENVRSSSSDSNSVFPVFLYYYNGKSYKMESSSGSYPPQFKVGEEVEMYIDPDSPEVFFVPADTTTKTISHVFSIVGAVIASLGLLIPLAIAILRGRNETSRAPVRVSSRKPEEKRYDGFSDEDYISTVEEYNRYDDENDKCDM